MPYFAPDYFDSGWFDSFVPLPDPAPEEGPLADGDYFECDYFDPTYFDTPDCGGGLEATASHRVGPIRRIPVPLEDPDELLALI